MITSGLLPSLYNCSNFLNFLEKVELRLLADNFWKSKFTECRKNLGNFLKFFWKNSFLAVKKFGFLKIVFLWPRLFRKSARVHRSAVTRVCLSLVTFGLDFKPGFESLELWYDTCYNIIISIYNCGNMQLHWPIRKRDFNLGSLKAQWVTDLPLRWEVVCHQTGGIMENLSV